jgi:hypothetical protein
MTASCPMSAVEVVDRYFLENRARLLEIAAFFDRVDRCADAAAGRRDYRYAALREALESLADLSGDACAEVLRALSDPTETPIADASHLKGAAGAWKGAPQ